MLDDLGRPLWLLDGAQQGTCDNRSAIKRDELEDRVLRAMREHLMEPALFEEFCEAYTRAVNEWRIAQRAELAAKEAESREGRAPDPQDHRRHQGRLVLRVDEGRDDGP